MLWKLSLKFKTFATPLWHQIKHLTICKTEIKAVLCGSKTQQFKVSANSICVGESKIWLCNVVGDQGLLIDSTLHHHVSAVVRTCYFHLHILGKLRPFLTKKADFSVTVALVLSKLGYCSSSLWGLPSRETIFNLCRTQQQGFWHWQRGEDSSSLSWRTSTGFLWRILLTTRFFLWRTTASVAQLHNIWNCWFLTNKWTTTISLIIFSVPHLCIPKVWMKTIPKSSSASGLSSSLSPDSGMLFLRRWENLSFFQLFTGNSGLICFQISDYTIIHLFVFFSVCVLHCLHLAKRLPQHAPWAWLFYGCLSALQIDDHHKCSYIVSSMIDKVQCMFIRIFFKFLFIVFFQVIHLVMTSDQQDSDLNNTVSTTSFYVLCNFRFVL